MKILFFAPLSGIWINKVREAALARDLRKEFTVDYMFCNGIYNPFCINMLSNGLSYDDKSETRKDVCDKCKVYRTKIEKEVRCKSFFLDDFYSIKVKENHDKLLSNTNKDNYQDLIIDEVEVGKIALYEFLINRKKRSYSLSFDEWNEYSHFLSNCIKTHLIMREFLRYSEYHAIFIQNSLYSINRDVFYIANKYNIYTYTYDNNLNLSNQYGGFIFAKDSSINFYNQLARKHWSNIKDIPISIKSINRIIKHIKIQLESKNRYAFSSKHQGNRNLNKELKIPNGKKIVLVATSSYDELFSAISNKSRKSPEELNVLYTSLEEWLREIINWAHKNLEYYFIIRIHPREAKMVSGTSVSENLLILKELLKDENLPSNVMINWPDDDISLYDLFDITDLVLSAWSSVGYESIMYQIPVLLFSDKLIFYPKDFNSIVSTSSKAYFDSIELECNNKKSIRDTIQIFRWLNLYFNGSTIPINLRIWFRIFNYFRCLRFQNKYPLRSILRRIGYERNSVPEIKDFVISRKVIREITKVVHDGYDTICDLDNKIKVTRISKIIEKKYIVRYFRKKNTVNKKRILERL